MATVLAHKFTVFVYREVSLIGLDFVEKWQALTLLFSVVVFFTQLV